MKISQIVPDSQRPELSRLILQNGTVLTVETAYVQTGRLQPGDDADVETLAALQSHDDENRLMEAALRFLGPRPRSRAEIRRRLLRPGKPSTPQDPEAIERVLDRLEGYNYVNDADFARFWVENRDRFNPRAARVVRQELRQRGVARDTTDDATDPELDTERALNAGRKYTSRLTGMEYQSFRERTGQFLMRRGFSYDVTRATVQALWNELPHDEPDGDSGDE